MSTSEIERPCTVFHARASARCRSNAPLYWTPEPSGQYHAITRAQFQRQVEQFALGLRELGFESGDAFAILSTNRLEWVAASLAAMALGGVAIGVYPSSDETQLAYVLQHSTARFVLVDTANNLARVMSCRTQLPSLEHIITVDAAGSSTEIAGAHTYDAVLAKGAQADARAFQGYIDQLQPLALATLIYTSGTTGEPKGVMLSHETLLTSARALSQALGIGRQPETFVSYLPLAHIAEQLCTIYGPALFDVQVYFAPSLERIAATLQCARPTSFFSVPRLWLKMQLALQQEMARLPRFSGWMLEWARRVTAAAWRRRGAHAPPSVWLTLQAGVARLVLAKLKRKLGLNRARLLTSSAAPISTDTLEFFASLDIHICELYGQSEIVGATTLNTPQATRFGSVGRVLPGVEVKLAPDGEILVRGETLFMGYFKNAAATSEVVQEGWLRSGDLGFFDTQGYLYVLGRKKEMITLADGTRVPPALLEERLKMMDPIEHALVVGERQTHLAAVLTLDAARARAFAQVRGLPEDLALLAREPALLAYIHEQLERIVNSRCDQPFSVRRFVVVPEVLSIASGELTPTLKMKRNVVSERWRATIEALFHRVEETAPRAPAANDRSLASTAAVAVSLEEV